MTEGENIDTREESDGARGVGGVYLGGGGASGVVGVGISL